MLFGILLPDLIDHNEIPQHVLNVPAGLNIMGQIVNQRNNSILTNVLKYIKNNQNCNIFFKREN